MHACALAVNDLYHELKLMRPSDAGHLLASGTATTQPCAAAPTTTPGSTSLMARAEGPIPGLTRSRRAFATPSTSTRSTASLSSLRR